MWRLKSSILNGPAPGLWPRMCGFVSGVQALWTTERRRRDQRNVKPKPHSIQRRFVLLQASSFALAIWLLCAALYVNLKIHRDLTQPIADLHSALEFNAQIEAAQNELVAAAAQAYFHNDVAARQRYEASAQALLALERRYANLPLPDRQRQALHTIRVLQLRLAESASRQPAARLTAADAARRYSEIREVDYQIEALLLQVAQEHLADLERASAQLHRYALSLYFLLTVFGAFATVLLLVFRRSHRREIWKPLEELRRMVGEIRAGNLNVSSKVPDSIEFGKLLQGFLAMAEELRAMRNSLEEKVRERTAKLEATQGELIQAAKLSSLGQLVAGVAHEINNPLTSILGFSELALARADLDPGVRRQMQTIREESLRLKHLVASLGSFARRAPQHIARVDLREVLGRVADLRRYQLSANNIALHCELPAEPVWIQADREQLFQVFLHLVLNSEQAILARPHPGDIWFACGLEGEQAWATVRDNGVGIPPEIQAHVFDPFFTTKPTGKGSGLGLSVSHGIIEQHHGSISVESIAGRGTTLRVLLPAAAAGNEAAQAENVRIPLGTSERRALVVDDEAAIARFITEYLESAGWQCTTLSDSTGVEAALDSRPFDLLICDLKMPGKNGLEILEAVRQKDPELAQRFLLITGNLDDIETEEAVRRAGVALLRKPFTLEQLGEAVRALFPQGDVRTPS